MARIKVTNRTLIDFHHQLAFLESNKEKDIMYYLLNSRIKQWNNDNGVRVNSIMEKMREMGREYYKHSAIDGKAEFEMVKDETTNQMNAVLKEGKTQEDFDKAQEELLSQENSMEV